MYKLPHRVDICDMIFKSKVRQILVCSDYSPLYITTHTYYSYVYVIAECKVFISTGDAHRNAGLSSTSLWSLLCSHD